MCMLIIQSHTLATQSCKKGPAPRKESLASRKVLKSTQPPEGSAAAPEPEPEEEAPGTHGKEHAGD